MQTYRVFEGGQPNGTSSNGGVPQFQHVPIGAYTLGLSGHKCLCILGAGARASTGTGESGGRAAGVFVLVSCFAFTFSLPVWLPLRASACSSLFFFGGGGDTHTHTHFRILPRTENGIGFRAFGFVPAVDQASSTAKSYL